MNILCKRLLSGILDLLLIGFIAKILSFFIHAHLFFFIFIAYFAIYILCKGTPGSLLLGTKIAFLGKKEKYHFLRLSVRSGLVMLMLSFLGCLALHGKYYPLEALQTAFFFTAINIAPMIFHHKELMLHDILCGSYVQNNNKPCDKNKLILIWSAFTTLMLLILFS